MYLIYVQKHPKSKQNAVVEVVLNLCARKTQIQQNSTCLSKKFAGSICTST